MSVGEFIQDMYTCFLSILNEIKCFGENITMYKLTRNVLWILPSLWEKDVNTIVKVKYLYGKMDEFIGNLKMYDLETPKF